MSSQEKKDCWKNYKDQGGEREAEGHASHEQEQSKGRDRKTYLKKKGNSQTVKVCHVLLGGWAQVIRTADIYVEGSRQWQQEKSSSALSMHKKSLPDWSFSPASFEPIWKK